MKQIKENGDKDVNFPTIDTSKIFIKPNDNWFNINSPPLFDKIPTLANFSNDIKLFNEIPKPRINFNVQKQPDNKLNQKNENEITQNNGTELPLKAINNNNLKKKNENQIENCKIKDEIKMPNFPSFFSDNKENNNKNKNLENPINTSINSTKIGNAILNNSPIKNNNKYNVLLNYMKPPSLINNICSNYISDYKLTFDNFLFPTFGNLPVNPSLKNNLILNSLNNKLNYFPLNMMEINNEINKNRIENNLFGNINLLGNKRV